AEQPNELAAGETASLPFEPAKMPANCGLFGRDQERPVGIELRGGPGRTRTSNQTVMSWKDSNSNQTVMSWKDSNSNQTVMSWKDSDLHRDRYELEGLEPPTRPL